MKKFIILYLSVALMTLQAADVLSLEGTKKVCEKSLSLIAQMKIKEGFEVIKPHWSFPHSEIDDMAYTTQSQMKGLTPRFGHIIGFTHIETKRLANEFIKHIYLLKYERYALRFEYIFYKPKNHWTLGSFIWDDSVGKLFK